ncbi:MAG: hypothetical protein ACI4MH_07080 [Candidatus Coproplasma sp.]
MKKLFKRFSIIFAVAASLLIVCGCSLFYSAEISDDGQYHFGVSNRDAFLISYVWDGTEEGKTLVIPDEFNGVPVTRLGGYTGRGCPCPFGIWLPEAYSNDSDCDLSDDFFDNQETVDNWFPDGYEIIEITFTVVLGKNVQSLYYSNGDNYYRQFTTEGQPTKLYKAVFCYSCSEDNPKFYSQDGVLYEKSTGEQATWER